MPMSSGGHVASSSGCATRPKVREIGLTGCAVPTQRSLLIGSYVMATAEHREPCDSRGSCTVLGAPGGEIPPGDSTGADITRLLSNDRFTLQSGHRELASTCPFCAKSGLTHRSKKPLFDHLVGEDVELRRDRHAERVGGLAIDHQVEFRRLLDRQVAGLCALDNLVDERCGAAEEIEEALADGSTVPADHRQPGRAPLGKSVFEATHLEAACTQRCDRFV